VSDVIFIAVLLAFFVLCTLYVQLCDRMIGPDELAIAAKGEDSSVDGESPTLMAAVAGTTDGVKA
jgi:hypothetical protein